MYRRRPDMWFLFSQRVKHAVIMLENIIATIKSGSFLRVKTSCGVQKKKINFKMLIWSCVSRVAFGSSSGTVSTEPTQTLQKSDNKKGLVLMWTAGRGLTFLWLQFKEFDVWNNAHHLPEIPCLNLSKTTQTRLHLIPRVKLSWMNVFLLKKTQIEMGSCSFYLSRKPKNKGPCIRSGVCGSQAPAVGMPSLKDSSCWPDIAWRAERPPFSTSLVRSQSPPR